MTRIRDNRPGDVVIIQAGWIHPVMSAPIENAAIAIKDGEVLALGRASEILEAFPGPSARFEYPDGTMLPGLVDAHAHLELSYMKDLVPPREDFTSWIVDLVRAKRSWGDDEFEKSTRAGRREHVPGGCTAVGDIVSKEAEMGAMAAHEESDPPLRVRAYQEFLGRFDETRASFKTDADRRLFPGISPHAPYSSDANLFRRCIERARERQLPISTHGAETRWEERYMLEGKGPLHEFPMKLGMDAFPSRSWDPAFPSGLAGWLAAESPPKPLQFVHGTWLDEKEFSALKTLGATVVYCPASVAYFHGGRDSHPVEELLAADIPVALGTDSLASGWTLNMPETCSLAYRAHPGLSPSTILEMATRSGSRSLAFQDRGALAPGMRADIVVFDSPGARPSGPEEALEMAILSGFAVPSLHVIDGELHVFADLIPLRA